MRLVAFLRGINVGGHKLIKMEELSKAFNSMGFKNVKTLLASGNVLFDTQGPKSTGLAEKIEHGLEKLLGHKIGVLLRTLPELKALADSRPFNNIKISSQTRLYITFLSEKPKTAIKAPYESPAKQFKILRISQNEVLSVLELSPDSKSTDLMGFLDKEFGRAVTTRNWNTIEKLLDGA
jgi:uncharacterized protein (DUF1697 family)